MAITASGRWYVTFDLMEASLKKTEKRYEVVAADYAAAVIAAADILAKLEAVTDMEVLGYHFYEVYEESTPVTPAAGTQKENQALLTFRDSSSPMRTFSHSIPAPKQGIFVSATGANSDTVDLADADVIAYAAMFAFGGVALLSDGETADQLEKGKRRHVGNPNG